ncbi:MAG: radical SAM protein [Planctomycetota bacterium]|nr:radical SAM protein [Planctomycetota bacterium]
MTISFESRFSHLIGRATVPFTVIIEATRRCNLRCRHCYVVGRPGRQELSNADISALLRDLRKAGTLFVTFTGGEALLRDGIIKLLARSAELGLATQLLTNATLLTGPAIRSLAGLPVNYVGTSVYGAHARTHDWTTRHRGSFAKTIRAVRMLRDAGVPVFLKYLVMRQNASELDASAALAARLKVPIDYDFMVTPRDDGDRAPCRLRVGDRLLERVFRALHDEGRSARGMFCSFSEAWHRSRQQTPEAKARPGTENKTLRPTTQARSEAGPSAAAGPVRSCAAGSAMCSVSAYGDVFPCLQIPVSAGSILEQPFLRIWKGSRLLRRFRGKDWPAGGAKCNRCAVREYCSRCPGVAYLDTGDMDGPSEEACRQARLLARVLEGRR